MKAVAFSRVGGPEVLTWQEVPEPQVGEGQVLVRVEAAGMNFGDTIIRSGKAPFPLEFPFVTACEASGVVERLGAGVTGISVGDRVAAPLFLAGRAGGAAAERIAVDAALLIPLPEGLTFEQGAALTVQGITARWMLDHVPAKGRTVLVHAAAGGVGALLVQLAKQEGARRIVATASTAEKRAEALRLGADVAVDYTQADWSQAVKDATGGLGPDVIYDAVAGDVRKRSLEVLAARGTYVMYGGAGGNAYEPLDAAQMAGLCMKNQFVTGFSGWLMFGDVRRVRADLTALFEEVRAGRLEVVIGARHRMQEAAAAHRALESRATTGKVVLVP
uniref:Enoyl reductase (ER) domain-containing protein n=1 Tax=Cystobacterineae bacterium TaxID=1934914 RepID=A0A3S7UVT0_9BACT|nr:hypothetical protein [Myxococcaceae bacterium MCy9487]